MSKWHLYDKTNGMFLGRTFTAPEAEANLDKNVASIHGIHKEDGLIDHLSQQLDLVTGKVIDYRPLPPSSEHEWNACTKRWQRSLSAKTKEVAAATMRVRLAHLRTVMQPDIIRRLLLGDETQRAALQAVEDEINQLEHVDSPVDKGSS